MMYINWLYRAITVSCKTGSTSEETSNVPSNEVAPFCLELLDGTYKWNRTPLLPFYHTIAQMPRVLIESA